MAQHKYTVLLIYTWNYQQIKTRNRGLYHKILYWLVKMFQLF